MDRIGEEREEFNCEDFWRARNHFTTRERQIVV